MSCRALPCQVVSYTCVSVSVCAVQPRAGLGDGVHPYRHRPAGERPRRRAAAARSEWMMMMMMMCYRPRLVGPFGPEGSRTAAQNGGPFHHTPCSRALPSRRFLAQSETDGRGLSPRAGAGGRGRRAAAWRRQRQPARLACSAARPEHTPDAYAARTLACHSRVFVSFSLKHARRGAHTLTSPCLPFDST
jgi:hypothetical protein